MNKLSVKITFFVFTLIITLGLFYVLFFSYPDKLVKYVPAEAETYLNMRTKYLAKVSTKEKDLFLTWLTQHNTLEKSQWEQLFSQQTPEIGFFTINKQVFGILKNTPEIKKALTSANISLTETPKIIFIPKIKLNNNSLAKESWFKDLEKKLNFSQLTLYTKNLKALNISPSMLAQDGPVAVSTKNFNKKTCYKTSSGINSTNKTTNINRFDQTKGNLYLNGVETDAIAQDINYTLENLPILLLKNMIGPVEFISDKQNFAIRVNKAGNNELLIQNKIKFILAQVSPTEKIKYLPDDSPAIQLIADAKAYQFKNVNNDQQQIIFNNEKYQLNLFKDTNFYFVTDNSEFFEKVKLANPQENPQIKYGVINLNLNNDKEQLDLTFLGQKYGKVLICID